MALSDPQSVTINAVAYSMPNVSRKDHSSSYRHTDGNVSLAVSNAEAKRNRRVIRIDFQKIAPDPLISSQNIVYKFSTYLVVDAPITGFTVVEQKQVVDGFITMLNASSGAMITKVLGGES